MMMAFLPACALSPFGLPQGQVIFAYIVGDRHQGH